MTIADYGLGTVARLSQVLVARGNAISFAVQEEKFRLVSEVARAVWRD